MKALGFRRGRSNPCVFHHPERDLRCVVHGDDFFSEGMLAALAWFEKAILKEFEGKVGEVQEKKTAEVMEV